MADSQEAARGRSKQVLASLNRHKIAFESSVRE